MNILICFTILTLTMFFAGCSIIETSEATHILSGTAYPPTNANEVSILLEKPDKAYSTLGIVESRGMGITNEERDLKLSINALKAEAASIGANAVIIQSSQQQIASISSNGTSTERRIKGIAIRYISQEMINMKNSAYAIACTQTPPEKYIYIEKSMDTINAGLKEQINRQPVLINEMKEAGIEAIYDFRNLSLNDKHIICSSIDANLKKLYSNQK